MSVSGDYEPIYVAARRTLLDALDAVHDQIDGVVVVGAQAIYLHAGDADFSIAPYTTDGDLALDPARLLDRPSIEQLLTDASFQQSATDVGAWTKPVTVEGVWLNMVVDLLVPESVGGPGRRAARIAPHGKRTARKVAGLEGVLVDNELMGIHSLEDADPRTFKVAVGGPGGLLVAKLHKIAERVGFRDRQSDKDAFDVLRLLRATEADDLARRLVMLRSDPSCSEVTSDALRYASELFGSPRAPGSRMAARSLAAVESEETIANSAALLMSDLLIAVNE
jgi:hypothetical protein